MVKHKQKPFDISAQPQKGKSRPPEVGIHWTIAAVCALMFSICLFITLALPQWRVTELTTIHYVGGRYAFKSTYFGLFIIYYNQGLRTTTWDRQTSLICSINDQMVPFFMQQELFHVSNILCPASCRAHYTARCNSYRKITTLNYVMITFLLAGGCLGLCGSGWVFIFGPHRTCCMILWGFAGLLPGALSLFWVYLTDQIFHQLMNDSNYPYPSIHAGVYLEWVGSSGLILCALLAGLAAWHHDRQQWKQKQMEIDQRIIGEEYGKMPFAVMGSPFPHPAMEKPLDTRQQRGSTNAPQTHYGFPPMGHAPVGFPPMGHAPVGFPPMARPPMGFTPQGGRPQQGFMTGPQFPGFGGQRGFPR